MKNVLSTEQQKFLLDVAHRAIQHYLDKRKTPEIKTEDGVLQKKRGAFVTLKVDDQLRGCIGYPIPHKPLIETIIDCAIAAASQDHRFPSIKTNELGRTEVEISVLTLPRKIEDISEIIIGDHGIIISKGMSKGLLLPQVPVEWSWDLETYLNHGCLKAGLPEDAWKKGAKIEIFSAQVFGD
ncbi:AmmeMemoRadiSam system protein A [Acidobacteriota bacterium]